MKGHRVLAQESAALRRAFVVARTELSPPSPCQPMTCRCRASSWTCPTVRPVRPTHVGYRAPRGLRNQPGCARV